MMKGVSGSLKIRGPGLTLQECIKFVACLSREEDRIIWITVLKVLLQKLLNHANPADTKVLFQEVEVKHENLPFVNDLQLIWSLLTIVIFIVYRNQLATVMSLLMKLIRFTTHLWSTKLVTKFQT